MEPRFGLGSGEFSTAFPFHVVFDREMHVRQVGAVIERLIPGLGEGGPLERHFRIVRPQVSADFEAVRARARSMFLLETRSREGLVLKGQMLPVENPERIAFLCSPWVTDIQKLGGLGLSLNDFAVHDPVADYLFLLQTQNKSLVDLNRLTERLGKVNQE